MAYKTIGNLRQLKHRSASDCLTHNLLTLEFVAVFPLEFRRILL
jgi:hypothetical protein